jgi:hypothetical protein
MNNTPNMQQDLLKFLQILSEQGAEFIIVGGVATITSRRSLISSR